MQFSRTQQLTGNAAQIQQLCFAPDGQALPPNTQIGFVQKDGKMVPLILLPTPSRSNSKVSNMTAYPIGSPLAQTGFIEQPRSQPQSRKGSRESKVPQKVENATTPATTSETLVTEGEGNMHNALMQLCAKNGWKVEISEDAKKKNEETQKVPQQESDGLFPTRVTPQEQLGVQPHPVVVPLAQQRAKAAQLHPQPVVRPQVPVSSPVVPNRTSPMAKEESKLGRSLMELCARNKWNVEVVPKNQESEGSTLERSEVEKAVIPQKFPPPSQSHVAAPPGGLSNRPVAPIVVLQQQPHLQPQKGIRKPQLQPAAASPTGFLPQPAPPQPGFFPSPPPPPPPFLSQQTLVPSFFPSVEDQLSHVIQPPKTSPVSPNVVGFAPQRLAKPLKQPLQRQQQVVIPKKVAESQDFQEQLDALKQQQLLQIFKHSENSIQAGGSMVNSAEFTQPTMSMSALASMLAPHVTPPPNVPAAERILESGSSLFNMMAFQGSPQFPDGVEGFPPLYGATCTVTPGITTESFLKEEMGNLYSTSTGGYIDCSFQVPGDEPSQKLPYFQSELNESDQGTEDVRTQQAQQMVATDDDANSSKARKELFGVSMEGVTKEGKDAKEPTASASKDGDFIFTPTRGKYKGVVAAVRGIGIHQCSLPNSKSAFAIGRGKPISV